MATASSKVSTWSRRLQFKPQIVLFSDLGFSLCPIVMFNKHSVYSVCTSSLQKAAIHYYGCCYVYVRKNWFIYIYNIVKIFRSCRFPVSPRPHPAMLISIASRTDSTGPKISSCMAGSSQALEACFAKATLSRRKNTKKQLGNSK